MTSLRILYVDTEPVWRGGQEQLLGLVSGMHRRGHRVWLAAPPRSPLSRRAARAGVPVHPFRQAFEPSPLSFLSLGWLARRDQAQILHLNTPRPVLTGGLAARLWGVPVCLCARRVNYRLGSRLSSLKYNRLLQATVAVSGSIRGTLLEEGVDSERVRVIYEGVDLSAIDALETVRLPGPAGGLMVGTVAHLSSEKGHRSLVEAAARVVARIPDARFALVGAGRLRPGLEGRVLELGLRDRVVFTGFRADAESLMKGFDVFCLPSLSEGLSSALMAAMGTGLPVVATRVGGNPELVVDGETGILVPPDDPEALAEALCRLLQSVRLRREMGRAGRRRVQERFTLERKLEETERLYRELLASAGFS